MNKTITVINQGAGGIGDGLLGLCAVLGYCAEHPDEHVLYQVGPKAIEFVELFEGPPCGAHSFDFVSSQTPSDDLQLNLDYHHEMASYAAIPRINRYCNNIGVKKPILPKLRSPKTVQKLGENYRDCIILAPCVSDSKYRSREYPRLSWATAHRILRQLGYRVVLVDKDPKRLTAFPDNAEKVTDCSAAKLAGIILNAKCVLGIDSAPAHLGGILGRPTIVTGGTTQPEKIFGFYPKVVGISGKLDCDGCWWNPPFSNLICETGCPSIAAVTPQEIVDTFHKVVPRPARTKALITAWKRPNRNWVHYCEYAEQNEFDLVLGEASKNERRWHSAISTILRALYRYEIVVWVHPSVTKIPTIKLPKGMDVKSLLGGKVVVMRSQDWVKSALLSAWNLKKRFKSLSTLLLRSKHVRNRKTSAKSICLLPGKRAGYRKRRRSRGPVGNPI